MVALAAVRALRVQCAGAAERQPLHSQLDSGRRQRLSGKRRLTQGKRVLAGPVHGRLPGLQLARRRASCGGDRQPHQDVRSSAANLSMLKQCGTPPGRRLRYRDGPPARPSKAPAPPRHFGACTFFAGAFVDQVFHHHTHFFLCAGHFFLLRATRSFTRSILQQCPVAVTFPPVFETTS